MAARRVDVGKQAVALVTTTHHIWKWKPPANPSSSSATLLYPRRRSYTSVDSDISVDDNVYEKNPDDGQGPSPVVPDELIQPESEEYWTPHPQTGVFVPPSLLEQEEQEHGEEDITEADDAHTDISIGTMNDGESVLDQTAFYRPTSIEDLDKPIDADLVDPLDNNEAAEHENNNNNNNN